MANNIVKRPATAVSRSLRDDLFSPFEQVFDDFFTNFFTGSVFDKVKSTSGYPKMDVFEQDGYWVVQAAIPGVKPDDVEVEIIPSENSFADIPASKRYYMLRIRGKMSEEVQSSGTYQVRELKKSSFSRTITLPTWVQDDPEAAIKDGILTLKWQLPQEQVLPGSAARKITIKKDGD